MRIPPPRSLRLDRRVLLREALERLSARLPEWARRQPDPTDAGWLLLEQAAWMTEDLSRRLDQYPLSVLQELMRLFGAELGPARPAVGVVCLAVRSGGWVSHPDVDAFKAIAPQTERRDLIELVPLERSVPVRPATVLPLVAVGAGGMLRVGEVHGDAFMEGAHVRRGAAEPVRVFERERFEFVIHTAGAAEVARRIRDALARLQERAPGWLVLEVVEPGGDQVVVQGRISPAAALRAAVGGVATPGGDLVVPWRPLEELAWTPPVRVADRQDLPSRLRGAIPAAGALEGTLLLAGVPGGLLLDGLLVREPAPVPRAVLDAIWATLARSDVQLAPLRPVLRRSLAPAEEPEPEEEWVDALLRADAWGRVEAAIGRVEDGRGLALAVRLLPDRGAVVPLRLAVGARGDPDLSAVRAVIWGGRASGTAVVARVAWRLPVPAADGAAREHLVALEVDTPADAAGIVFALPSTTTGAHLNPALVVNAVAVRDGRRVDVTRAVPEAVSLVGGDVVTRAAILGLGDGAVRAGLGGTLAAFPVARLDVTGGEPILDWAGVGLDPVGGLLVLNAPDAHGAIRELVRGTGVDLTMYRRTDGAEGNLAAGEVAHVEAAEGLDVTLLGVDNPVPTFGGADAETADACRDRVFAPTDRLPVTPGDWEHRIRTALGDLADGWVIRVWSYAERTLFTGWIWPLDQPDPALDSELRAAGPDTLVVALGGVTVPSTEAEIAGARLVIDGVVAETARRIPAIRRAVVTRLHPLRGATDAGFDLRDAGELVDPEGHRAVSPGHGTLLNGYISRGSR